MTPSVPRSITCAEADELAVLCVLDALTPEEAAPLHAHLETCTLPHESIAAAAGAAGALSLSVEPVEPPVDLRSRVMAAISTTPQDALATTPRAAPERDVPAAPAAPLPFRPRGRPRPERFAWIGLAAAAVLAIVLVGWNVSLQGQLAERTRQVAALETRMALAQQRAEDADTRVTALERQLAEQQDRLTAALDRADRSEAEVTTLRDQVATTRAELTAARQTLAAVDSNVALAGQAVAAAAAPQTTLATLTSAEPAFGASGLAIFPVSGDGYILLDGLPALDTGRTYQAWYLAGDGTPTSAGVVAPGPGGLTILPGVARRAGTDAMALTVEPEGGVPLPTGPVVVSGELPGPLG